MIFSCVAFRFPLASLPYLFGGFLQSSYLSDRSSSTVFHSSRSPWIPVPIGHPQGSVLDPLLYILFTADLESALGFSALSSHPYADDVQSYLHRYVRDALNAVRSMY